MENLNLEVNGRAVQLQVQPHRLLVEVLREHLSLTGTHVGCDTSQCGACVVHIDGDSVKSCTLLALQAEGAQITTIEGLAKPDGTLHPMQEAFREYHALQCGFCTAGILMSSADWLQRQQAAGQRPDEAEVRDMLSGHLCRCTGYTPIVNAVMEVACA